MSGGPDLTPRGYHEVLGTNKRCPQGRVVLVYVRTKKQGWMVATFRCKRLQGIERGVLEAVFTITGGSNRLFGGGFASTKSIAVFLRMNQTEENHIKIRAVLVFLKSNTWLTLDKRAEAGSTEGATRMTVSKFCYRLSKAVLKKVERDPLYINHIWGSGSDSNPKSKPENLVRGFREAAASLGFSGPMLRRTT